MQLKQLLETFIQMKMPNEIIEKLAPMITSKMIYKGEIITHVGDLQNEVFFVISGLLRSYYIDINGNDVTRFFMMEDSFYGSEILLNPEPSKCCVEALENCKVLVIDADNLKILIESNMYFMKVYIKALECGLRYKIGRESSFLLESATERYINFKKVYPKLEERVNQAYIASYLGITPVSLSRIRRTIKEEF